MQEIIQTILTPFQFIDNKYRTMYLRGNKYFCNKEGHIFLKSGGYFSTDTYYNALSIEKWKKYTRLNDLFLRIEAEGNFLITVKNDYRIENEITTHVLEEKQFSLPARDVIDIELTKYIHLQGMISFSITVLNDSKIYRAEYISTTAAKPVKVALGICTYKRESYVYRLIDEYIKLSREDILLLISDNAGTLNAPHANNVYVFKNKNYGGAGGFTRCMLEAKRYNKTKEKEITHIILMDDDILIDMRVIEKTINFLRLLKDEYHTYFLCGAMCSLDRMNIQYERNSHYLGGNNFHQFGANFDLSKYQTCIINEEDKELTRFSQCTAGWWYCCFSLEILGVNNYPFPCFFRGDDVEFAIRNGSNVITLNGINVWHEPFYKKYSNTSEKYYMVRNLLVINTLYRKNAIQESISFLDSCVKMCLYQYDYDGLQLVLKAMDDYFEGPVFFEKTEAEQYNKELSKYNHKMIPFTEALEEYEFRDILDQANVKSDSSELVHTIRKLTLNGYLIPSFLYKPLRVSGVGFRGRSYSYFRRKRVFNADTFSYRGYFTEIDKKKALTLFISYKKKIKYFRNNFEEIQNQYSLNFSKLQTEDFWIQYLNIDPIENE